MKIDFVTVVFDDEINLLFLQAHSISKYVDPLIINKIYIIYNDKNYSYFEQYFYKTIYDQYDLLKNCVVLLNYLQLFDTKTILNECSGWRMQQLIKLIVSKIVSVDYYLVLDSKNHFIRNLNLESFIKKNKCIMYIGDIGIMEKYFNNCIKYFNITDSQINKIKLEEKMTNKLPITITPYLFKTQIVNFLISYIETREKDFCKFFLNNTSITEFHLYSSFIIYSQVLDQFYISDKFDHIAIFNIYPSNETTFIDLVKKAMTDEIMTFAVHRTRFKNLTSNQKEILLKLFKQFYDDKIVNYILNNILICS